MRFDFPRSGFSAKRAFQQALREEVQNKAGLKAVMTRV
jgi:hypothetical protein